MESWQFLRFHPVTVYNGEVLTWISRKRVQAHTVGEDIEKVLKTSYTCSLRPHTLVAQGLISVCRRSCLRGHGKGSTALTAPCTGNRASTERVQAHAVGQDMEKARASYKCRFKAL